MERTVKIAMEKRFKDNLKEKHSLHAKYGWYRYNTRFALPVYGEEQILEQFNIFQPLER